MNSQVTWRNPFGLVYSRFERAWSLLADTYSLCKLSQPWASHFNLLMLWCAGLPLKHPLKWKLKGKSLPHPPGKTRNSFDSYMKENFMAFWGYDVQGIFSIKDMLQSNHCAKSLMKKRNHNIITSFEVNLNRWTQECNQSVMHFYRRKMMRKCVEFSSLLQFFV